MLRTGSLIFIVSLILGFKFKFFWLLALVIAAIYVILVPYYFLIMKTCVNCGTKNPPFNKKCVHCGEEHWRKED